MAYHPQLHQRLCEIVDALIQSGLPLEPARREFEKVYLVRALLQHGTRSKAAEALGIHRNTLTNRMKILKIIPADYRRDGRRGSRR